jgi:hypothetical protein
MTNNSQRCGTIAPDIVCNRPKGHSGYHSEYTEPAVIEALDVHWATFHPDEPLTHP